MKRIISSVMVLILALSLCACESKNPTEPGNSENSQTQTNAKIEYVIDCKKEELKTDPEIDAAADKLKTEIENYPDTVTAKEGGTVYYVSNKGNDDNDGTSEATPFATLAMANLHAKEGDCVKLERGGLWRGSSTLKEGVNYGAYGTGEKPAIYGAKKNGVEYEWTKSEEDENIYICKSNVTLDIGVIVFDHGKAWANRKTALNKVKKDHDFYCERGTGKIYVYSSVGNPGEIYSDIEICETKHVLEMKSNSIIENWRVMYGGAHGIAMGSVENVEIRGCIVAYIGGGLQAGYPVAGTRFGNGIEVWGPCNGYTIDHCHVYQCYDAGVTFQYISDTEDDIYEQNISFTSNLLEYSTYNLEYFFSLENSLNGSIKDTRITGNILRFGGYGWGYDSRPDKRAGTNVSGGGSTTKTENFVFENNIFEHARSFLLRVSASNDKYMPSFSGNTFALKQDSYILSRDGNRVKLGEFTAFDLFKDESAKVIIYDN